MGRLTIALTLLAGLAGLAAATPAAHADAPRSVLVHPPKDLPPNTAAIGPGQVIYFNRNGGTYTKVAFGSDDSRLNQTSLPGGTLSPFQCGDAVWQQVMACLRETWGPYNVVITDVDPSPAPHVESVVAGDPSEVGLDGQTGGIAPASCLFFDNPITYTFANVNFANCNPEQICWYASQETAHAFGLSHEILCGDPMTYDSGCGVKKRFLDQTAPCFGSNPSVPANCFCGGSQQNSHQELMQIFGARPPTPPMAHIDSPADGATVQTGVSVYATATDDVKVTLVQLFIDGTVYNQTDIGGPIYGFNVGNDVAPGQHTLTVRATDQGGLTGEHSIVVTIEPPCTKNEDCDDGQVCDVVSGQCVAGPGQQGGLGSPCTDNAMCESGICAGGPDGMRCVTLCTPGGAACPDGFDCLSAGASGACWPSADVLDPPDDGGGCGCRAGGRSGAALPGLLFAAVLLAAALRLRRRS